MNRRLFTHLAIALAALGAGSSALAQDKVVMGVAIPAATHGWAGGVLYWANRTKGELEKQYPGMQIIVKTAGSAAEQANQVQDLQTVNKIERTAIPAGTYELPAGLTKQEMGPGGRGPR